MGDCNGEVDDSKAPDFVVLLDDDKQDEYAAKARESFGPDITIWVADVNTVYGDKQQKLLNKMELLYALHGTERLAEKAKDDLDSDYEPIREYGYEDPETAG